MQFPFALKRKSAFLAHCMAVSPPFFPLRASKSRSDDCQLLSIDGPDMASQPALTFFLLLLVGLLRAVWRCCNRSRAKPSRRQIRIRLRFRPRRRFGQKPEQRTFLHPEQKRNKAAFGHRRGPRRRRETGLLPRGGDDSAGPGDQPPSPLIIDAPPHRD